MEEAQEILLNSLVNSGVSLPKEASLIKKKKKTPKAQLLLIDESSWKFPPLSKVGLGFPGEISFHQKEITTTVVHDAMLEDVVYPAEIVGKRIKYRLDSSKIIKVFLDPMERNNTKYKLETFA